MAQGKVKWFKDDKGYGFITPKDGSADLFVHHSAIVSDAKFKTLAEGDNVEYTVGKGEKGPRAEQVSVLTKAA